MDPAADLQIHQIWPPLWIHMKNPTNSDGSFPTLWIWGLCHRNFRVPIVFFVYWANAFCDWTSRFLDMAYHFTRNVMKLYDLSYNSTLYLLQQIKTQIDFSGCSLFTLDHKILISKKLHRFTSQNLYRNFLAFNYIEIVSELSFSGQKRILVQTR